MPDPLLSVTNLEVSYGYVQALYGISLEVFPGEVVGLLGANGAGKSTTLRCISGLVAARAGEIRLNGSVISGSSVEAIVKAGVAHVPEGRHLFAGLSVLENLQMGAAGRYKRGMSLDDDIRTVFRLFPHLEERKHQLGWTLSGGEQQMVAIGRALVSHPKLLLLDEPSLGLAPIVVREVFAAIAELNREEGLTILLVEQNARMALGLSHRGYVLENGEVVLSGNAAELAKQQDLEAAYLGA